MSSVTSGVERTRGRPRSSAADTRILRVALRHIQEVGYEEMSMEHVAAEAGVGKATLYRRYRNKADLATAALEHVSGEQFAAPPPDDTREALVDHLRRFEQCVAAGGFGVLGALLGERSDPELLDYHRERVVTRGKARMRSILERGRERGDIRPDVNPEAATEMLVGSYFARRLAGGDLGGWAETVVDTLLRGAAR